MKKTLLHGLLALLAGFFSAGVVAEEYPPTRVLFIGNSYLYYNDSLHNHVKRMVAERYPMLKSRDIKYKSATIGGARLKHHNIDWLLAPGQIGVDEPFQAVVMQVCGQVVSWPKSSRRVAGQELRIILYTRPGSSIRHLKILIAKSSLITSLEKPNKINCLIFTF